MNKKNINFIGIGAPRSGTTWVYECLKEHPQVCFSSKKELYFFDRKDNYERGLDFYYSFFDHCSEGLIKGEFTATYLSSNEAPSRIKSNFPDVKIIVCLRNPIERAYSHYLYDRASKRVEVDFEEALKKNEKYIKMGLYFNQISHYLKYFKKDQIKIIFYEDIKERPSELIKEVCDFLNIDKTYQSLSSGKVINPSTSNVYKINFLNLNNIKKITNKLKSNLLGRFLINSLKIFKLNKLTNYLIKKNRKGYLDRRPIDKNPIQEETRKMLQRRFKEDISNLEKLTNKNLNYWR